MSNIAPSQYCFNSGNEAVIHPVGHRHPVGPRPSQFGESDPVRALNARLDKMLASLPKSSAPKTSAPAPDQGDEIDADKIFAARAKAIEEARTGTGTPAPVDDDIFSPAGAAAVFAKRM
jgi:hypothetical protein